MAEPITVTPTSMPVANGATATEGFHAGGSFHEFQARLRNNKQAAPTQQSAPQPKPATPPVSRETPAAPPQAAPQFRPPPPAPAGANPQPQLTPQQAAPPTDPNAAVDPNAPPPEVDPNAPPPEQQAAPVERQLSPEDFERWEKIRTSLDNGVMPDEFGKLMIPLENNGQVEWEPLEEVRKGRMRMKDHMRGVQQRDAERAQEAEYRQSYEEHFRSIAHPDTGADTMYEIYTRNGMRPQLEKLAARFAREEQEDYDTANGVAYATMMRLRINDTNDYRVQEAFKTALQRSRQNRMNDDKSRADQFRMSAMEKQHQARQNDTQTKAEMEVQRNQLAQLRPRAFEAVGLDHENTIHRDRFDQWLGAAIRQHKAKTLTPELIMQAARAALDDIRDEEQRRANAGRQPQIQQPPRPFTPKLGGGSGKIGGQQQAAAGGKDGWTPDSFAEHFKLRRWG